jgi:F0F1-type ATP synthase membrane subunit c/vacuolar-type H+-ATPase subunit K
MKKIVLLMLAIAAVAFASDGEVANQTLKAYSVVAAGIGLGLAALGGAIGMGNTAAATIADNYVHCISDDRSTSYLCTCCCYDCIICKSIFRVIFKSTDLIKL